MNISEIKNQRRWMALHTKVFEQKIKEAFNFFREHEIEPILIKGWAIAQFYPEKSSRIYSDIDLCVSPEKYQKSLRLLDSERGQRLKIDLHCGLRHLDTVGWANLVENSRLSELEETPVRVLRPEDHLRVLCVHWLTDGGAYKDKLFDIYYLVQFRPNNFDWDRCLNVVDETRRDWIIKTIGLAHKYCGLNISDLPFAEKVTDLPEWLVKTVEREWESEIRLKPLHLLTGNRRELWQQIKKRFPPNSIQATIEMEGKFDEKPRIFYQICSIFFRLKPSFWRFYRSIKVRIIFKTK